jgi:hypothetical protein
LVFPSLIIEQFGASIFCYKNFSSWWRVAFNGPAFILCLQGFCKRLKPHPVGTPLFSSGGIGFIHTFNRTEPRPTGFPGIPPPGLAIPVAETVTPTFECALAPVAKR